MKKGLAITLGVVSGLAILTASLGITYAVNGHVHDYVNNQLDQLVNDDAMDLSDTKIENKIDLSADQEKVQGIQSTKDVAGKFSFKFVMSGVPTEYTGNGKLISKITAGDTKLAYFAIDTNVQYESITHTSGDSITFTHDLFKKDGEKGSYTVRTYWVDHPSVYLDTKVTFSCDLPEEKTSTVSSSTPVSSNS